MAYKHRTLLKKKIVDKFIKKSYLKKMLPKHPTLVSRKENIKQNKKASGLCH